MKKIWDYIDKKEASDEKKAAYFVAANVLLWIFVPLCFCIMVGGLTGFSSQWLEGCFLITGYCSIGIGFFGSIIYYMRR